MRITVLGAGAFGSALAHLLERRGHEIVLWMRDAAAAAEFEATRQTKYLPGILFDGGPAGRATATADLPRAAAHGELVLAATPSHSIREVFGKACSHLRPDVVVVNTAKGLELETRKTVDQIYHDVLPHEIAARAAFLSGPTFAKEISRGLPAAIVVASRDAESCRVVQDELSTERLRIYTSDDVAGVEICGALKNVCAIGAGISDGMGYGDSARAAFITRGLAEIIRMGTRLGAHPQTFAGLAGMGDLMLTCTGDLSRNRRLGLELGRGRSLEEAIGTLGGVAEGVKTCAAARLLARDLAVEMPLCEAIHGVLYQGVSPQDAMISLMRRGPKPERV